MWEGDGANPAHSHTEMTEWNCHYRLPNKGLQCDLQWLQATIWAPFHSKWLLRERSILGSSINPNLPASRVSPGFLLIPCHVTKPRFLPLCHSGWAANTILTPLMLLPLLILLGTNQFHEKNVEFCPRRSNDPSNPDVRFAVRMFSVCEQREIAQNSSLSFQLELCLCSSKCLEYVHTK